LCGFRHKLPPCLPPSIWAVAWEDAGVATAAGSSVRILLALVAARCRLDPQVLGTLLAPLAGVRVVGGLVIADAALLEAVRWLSDEDADGDGRRRPWPHAPAAAGACALAAD
jgi:hypothetical protein